jgi:hypothetical protein
MIEARVGINQKMKAKMTLSDSGTTPSLLCRCLYVSLCPTSSSVIQFSFAWQRADPSLSHPLISPTFCPDFFPKNLVFSLLYKYFIFGMFVFSIFRIYLGFMLHNKDPPPLYFFDCFLFLILLFLL